MFADILNYMAHIIGTILNIFAETLSQSQTWTIVKRVCPRNLQPMQSDRRWWEDIINTPGKVFSWKFQQKEENKEAVSF